MSNEFCVRCDCRNRRFTGCKSKFPQEADGAKGMFSGAAELCGDALTFGNALSALDNFTLSKPELCQALDDFEKTIY